MKNLVHFKRKGCVAMPSMAEFIYGFSASMVLAPLFASPALILPFLLNRFSKSPYKPKVWLNTLFTFPTLLLVSCCTLFPTVFIAEKLMLGTPFYFLLTKASPYVLFGAIGTSLILMVNFTARTFHRANKINPSWFQSRTIFLINTIVWGMLTTSIANILWHQIDH